LNFRQVLVTLPVLISKKIHAAGAEIFQLTDRHDKDNTHFRNFANKPIYVFKILMKLKDYFGYKCVDWRIIRN